MTALLLLPRLPDAACAGHPEPLWDDHLHPYEPAPDRHARHQRARQICAHCPALEQCRQAVDEHSTGIWAGALVGTDIRRPPGAGERLCELCDKPYRHRAKHQLVNAGFTVPAAARIARYGQVLDDQTEAS